MEIVLVGLNFRTAPVEVREKVSFSGEQAQRAAEELRSQGILEETLVLSTCNRSEVYGVNSGSNRESAHALSAYLPPHCFEPENTRAPTLGAEAIGATSGARTRNELWSQPSYLLTTRQLGKSLGSQSRSSR